jgi:hypothetical protein
MKIDVNKKYRTRDGREVLIYAVDGAHRYPVHGAICYNGGWIGTNWTIEGVFLAHVEPSLDLVEQRATQTYYRRKWAKYGADGYLLDTDLLWYSTKEAFDENYGLMSAWSEEWETIEI